MSYRSVSYWFDSLGREPMPRPPLPGDLEVDVAIVGGGFTGLWTAYYLKRADPSCRIAVLEADMAGFGASGRNGGWCWASIAGLPEFQRLDPEKGAVLRDEIKSTIDEVGSVCASENIDAGYIKGGGIEFTTNRAQRERLQAKLAGKRAEGWTEEDIRWLEPEQVRERIRVAHCTAGLYSVHSARVHPAKLACGIADAAERHGVQVFEQTPVVRVDPGRVKTTCGEVRASRIVLALSGYIARLPGYEREIIPAYNYMIATEPLSDETWERVGISRGEGFGDGSRFITYAHRTVDNRIAIGGRGVGYFYGSRIDTHLEHNAAIDRRLQRALRESLPEIGDVRITHRWGGAFGISRDMKASVNFDERTGIASAGGYVGDGVAASNLAGRTLTDLLLDRKTHLVELPWVGHRSPRWEPEPLRWIGVRLGAMLNASADRIEECTGRRARGHDALLNALSANFGY